MESNHARPPYQSGACPAGPSSSYLVGRIRTSVPHRRRVVLDPLSYDESALSTGVEPAPPGRQPSRATRRVRERVSCDRQPSDGAGRHLRPDRGTPSGILAIENRGSGSRSAGKVEPRGIEPRSGGCKPPSWPPRAPSRATAGIRTRSAALATPCASDLTPRSHRGAPRAGFEPASPV